MPINSLKYCLRQALTSVSRNRWLALVSAGMIAVSLAILGGFLLAAVNVNQVMQNIQSNLEIAVFLEDNADAAVLHNKLDQLKGVLNYEFIDRHRGLQEFGKSMGDEALVEELTGESNPLPDIFRVRAKEGELVPVLAEQIEQLPGVDTVDYGREMAQAITGISHRLNTVSIAISLLLAVGAVFLIGTTIRLSVVIRHEEIAIMKHLGASDWFIRLPFLLEGLAIGWAGTLATVVVLGLAYYRLAALLLRKSPLFFLQPVTAPGVLTFIFASLLVLGTAMGGLGSIFSIRRFLRV